MKCLSKKCMAHLKNLRGSPAGRRLLVEKRCFRILSPDGKREKNFDHKPK